MTITPQVNQIKLLQTTRVQTENCGEDGLKRKVNYSEKNFATVV